MNVWIKVLALGSNKFRKFVQLVALKGEVFSPYKEEIKRISQTQLQEKKEFIDSSWYYST